VSEAPDPTGSVFAALGDPTRRRIVHELSANGPLTPTRLAARVGVTRQAVSKHLAALQLAGLGHSERIGRESIFELDTEPFAEVEAWMGAIGASWDRRLAAFRRHAEGPEGSAPSREGGSR
jgi:DNA-binding transcriptional ArsR family regulator